MPTPSDNDHVHGFGTGDEIEMHPVGTADRIATLEAENRILRGLVQTNPEWKCAHGLDVDHIGKCPSGFPGCACADDRIAVLCEDEERIVSGLKAEKAELERKNNTLMEVYLKWDVELRDYKEREEEFEEKIGELEQQLAKARKDTERLDYRDRVGYCVQLSCEPNGQWTLYKRGQGDFDEIGTFNTIREAIDAAQKENPNA